MKISVVTACFNSARTIGECLRSVAVQSHPHIEHLVIDGGSRDGTAEVVRSVGREGVCFWSESDRGIYDAWNKGIRRSTGDYVLILNSDDRLHDADVVSSVVERVRAHAGPGVVYGKLLAREAESGYTYVDGRPADLRSFLYRMDFCTLATAIRRDVFDRVGYFDERYRIASDYDWAIRLFKTIPADEIVFFDRIMTDFSVGGVSNREYRKAYAEIDEIIRRHFPFPLYLRHKAYAMGLLAAKAVLPAMRAAGALALWRRIKSRPDSARHR